MVVLPGQAKPAGATRSVFVIFEELAPGPEPEFILDGRWTLSSSGEAGQAITHHERITVALPSMDSADVAAAMSEALAILTDRIAARLSGS
jgi:hypothetical protein